MPATAVTTYLVDASDRVLSVSRTWLAFAQANGARHLVREHVVGRSLWEFVQGEPIRNLYRLVLEGVRSRDTPVILPFRCDSPGYRRYMRLVISHVVDGTLQFDSVLSRVEERDHLRLLDPGVPRSGPELPTCSQCKRLQVDTHEWLEPEDAIVRLGLFESGRLPQLTEVMCVDCGRIFRRELARLVQ